MLFSVPLSMRSGLVKMAVRMKNSYLVKWEFADTDAHFRWCGLCATLPTVLLPSGSTSWAIFNASVVAMSVLHGHTTMFIVSCFSIYFMIIRLIYKIWRHFKNWISMVLNVAYKIRLYNLPGFQYLVVVHLLGLWQFQVDRSVWDHIHLVTWPLTWWGNHVLLPLFLPAYSGL